MLLPPGAAPEARRLLVGRALRAFTDGYVAILLPVYLLALGLGTWEVGLVSTATLLGSALMTFAIGRWGHHCDPRHLLLGAAWLMCATGLPLALGLLFLRSALSQMDVPTRSAFVMAVVTPAERAAAASFTAVPRSLAASLSPALGGAMFAAGWLAAPLVACGALKILYDLAIWQGFRKIEPGRSRKSAPAGR